MSKYIDLEEQIVDDSRGPWGNSHDGIRFALSWLDNSPDQVPGRTITESEYSDIAEWARNFFSRGWEGRTVLAGAGITIVPDPEPTNAEKWIKFCSSKMGLDLDPWQANVLDKAGVKAPGGDDE